MSWAAIILGFALVDNVILSRLLGVGENAAAPGRMKAAAAVGIFTAMLMAASAVAGWALDSQVLSPLGLAVLRTPSFVLVVVVVALGLHAIITRLVPDLLRKTSVSISKVGLNAAVLGLVFISTRGGFTAGESLLAGLAAGAGYFLVAVLLTAIRKRLEIETVPRALKGLPLELITAGLMAYAFMAFDRAFLARVLGG